VQWPDKINGLYEAVGGFFILLHCWRLYKDKKVKGVSIVAVIFFTSWGVWNLWYYPHLNQWMSFVGGLFIVVSNSLWIWLLIRYRKRV